MLLRKGGEHTDIKELIKTKLTSRKFWVSLVGFAAAVAAALGCPEMSAEQAGVIASGCAALAAYVIGEGIADAKK